MSKYQIQYGPNASLDGDDVDLASADRLIESLRQQLSDHIKREVMLRDVLLDCDASFDQGRGMPASLGEALAATADLNGLILCHAEPIRWSYTTNGLHEWTTKYPPPDDAIDAGSLIPLYRAWEPK